MDIDWALSGWQAPPAPTSFNYYIDASHGNDANDGHTPETAWQTLKHLDQNNAFGPGTTIGLKRGEVWREDLMLNSSGATNAPITVGAYGDGAAPRVTGGTVLGGWSLAGLDSAGKEIHSTQTGADPKILVSDGTALIREKSTDLTKLDFGEWLFKDQKVFVKQDGAAPSTPTPPATPGTDIVVSAAGTPTLNVYPHFKVLIDNAVIGEGTANSAAPKDYAFKANVAPDQPHKVQIAFDNDLWANGQDRNLTVNAVKINGKSVAPTDPIVTYDRGVLDGKNVVSGRSLMDVNGTLVIAASKDFFPGTVASGTGTTTASGTAVANSHVYEIPARAGVIDLNGQHDVVVRDLKVDLGADMTIAAGGSNGITLMNLKVQDSTKIDHHGAIGFSNGSNAKILGLEIRGIVGTLPIYSWAYDNIEIAHTYVKSHDVGEENIVHLDGGIDPSEGYRLFHNVFDETGSNTTKHVVNVGQSTTSPHNGGGYVGYNIVRGGNGGLSVNNSGVAGAPLVVENNTVENYGKVTNNDWAGGFFSPGSGKQEHVLVKDNVFRNGVNGVALYDGTKSNMVFHNNLIDGMTGNGLFSNATISGEFVGNTIQNTAKAPIYVKATIPGQTWVVS